jgi:ABC-type protease/lipase transport system fused ATPase/permease subunit
LAVEQVFGAPPGAPRAFLHNISFALEPGQALGIIGASASGKSTLARHLIGLHTPIQGAVRLDGADVAKWDRDHLGRHIGYLPQDVEILSGTVAENISRFESDPASEDIIAAARMARVHEMILRLPAGYETEVGDAGLQVSAGQRQRIALARAVYGGPALVVLDEPNSNLDAEGEIALQQCIASLKANKQTVVVVGHRPSSIAQVDLILVLEEGRCRAFGPKAEVLAKVLAQAQGNVSPLRVAGDGAG